MTTQISSALGLQDDFTKLHWHTIIKTVFPSHYSLDQRGPPRSLPPCLDLDEKFYGTPLWLDCAYPTPVKQPLDKYRTNTHLLDWSQRQPLSACEGHWVTTAGWISPILVTFSGVIQKDIW
jgi:hypothetical protein